GQHFGATVAVSVPGTMYQVSAAGLSGTPGSADVVVNTGASLLEQQLEPGLAVRVFKTKKKTGKKTTVIRWAQALDDGLGVSSATFRIGGRSIHADATGKAKVPKGSGKAAAQGYAGASFRGR